VPPEIIEVLVTSLVTDTKVAVTKENAASLSVLVREFWLLDLLSAFYKLISHR
jgi:hypothetical protein